MSETPAQEGLPSEEQPLSREEVVLAQAEIKELLSVAFVDTFLNDLFIESVPVHPIDSTEARGLQKDYVGTRVISGKGIHSSQERILEAREKPRKIRKGQVEIGEVIRLIEPGAGSSIQPKIEHSVIELHGFKETERRLSLPNTRMTVEKSLELARQISKGR